MRPYPVDDTGPQRSINVILIGSFKIYIMGSSVSKRYGFDLNRNFTYATVQDGIRLLLEEEF